MALSMKDIKRKISSIQKTQQITKAMKMVAAAKLRKVQEATTQFRPYLEKIESIVSSLVESASPMEHPLLFFRDVKNVGVIIITSDRGLCGAFNHNVIKAAEGFMKNELNDKNINLTLIGKSAFNYFKFRGIEADDVYTEILKNKAHYSDAQRIMNKVVRKFVNSELDEVYLIYNRFINVLVQKSTVKKVLPVSIEKKPEKQDIIEKYIFEPSKSEVLNALLPRYVITLLYDAMLESLTGEHAARMTAMDAATTNAGNMIEALMLDFNKARQASITKELIEIVTSIEAMK